MKRCNSLFDEPPLHHQSISVISCFHCVAVFPGRLTGGAGPVRHPGDEPLLFAGRLSPVALVLVGVSVGAAHGDVVFVALEIKHNQMLIKRLKVTAAAHRTKQLQT